MQWSISENKVGAGILIRTLRHVNNSIGEEPKVGDIVIVHCETSLEDGPLVDSTRKRKQPLEFQVGAGDVIKGLEVAVQRMQVGQLVEVTVPHIYAYGTRGRMPEIPSEATIVLKVELLEIIPQKS
ncbi:unnamed protein product [Cylindrotheca closterium]|uniref:peptidylprolyl isomerase n=1 Tax=Cylindrotheca closterium TaxID=2856 RepID=A0AAD2JN95_9STRA|nr:unnamed protein product [Cylindrotheca closterium]